MITSPTCHSFIRVLGTLIQFNSVNDDKFVRALYNIGCRVAMWLKLSGGLCSNGGLWTSRVNTRLLFETEVYGWLKTKAACGIECIANPNNIRRGMWSSMNERRWTRMQHTSAICWQTLYRCIVRYYTALLHPNGSQPGTHPRTLDKDVIYTLLDQ